jgi:epoxyqueuosine reductase
LSLTSQHIKELAQACGFELAGVAAAIPTGDFERFEVWRAGGMAGEMAYLTDRRGDLRSDPRNLLPEAHSIVCVGKLYNTRHPASTEFSDSSRGWISRYAWGADYHDVLRRGLEQLVQRIAEAHGQPFQWKICVDTAPLLERSYARAAGLGWIGKNTCLINQQQGSWFFLGELLLSIPLARDMPPADRCGSCRRCIDACPTRAIVPTGEGDWTLDARRCISYLTIEKPGTTPSELAEEIGNHLFGCDICQDVCPWNSRAGFTEEPAFQPTQFAPSLSSMASLTEGEFRTVFHNSPVRRAKYPGFLRNVAIALGNAARKMGIAACALALIAASLGHAETATPELEDPLTNPGFVHFYNNQFDQAIRDFDEQVKAHPNEPDLYNHLAQSILYREMFRNGALESELVSGTNPFLRRSKMEISAADKARFADCIERSMKLSQEALAKDHRDVRALYSLAVAHGLRANYLFLVEKDWMASLHEFTTARRENQEILRIDPSFVDARLVLGLDEYIVGCLPFYLRAIGSIGGFHGDKAGGIRQLELVSRTGILNRYDADVILAVIYRREHCPEQAIPLLGELAAKFPANYLLRFEQVQMYSDLGDKRSALQVLAEIDTLRRSGAPGYATLPAEKVQYLKGNLLFWYGDLDGALADLKQVTRKTEDLDLNTAVMAWLRLGQTYDLQGERQDAIGAYRETIKTAPKSDAANEAKGYISAPYHRKRA